MRTEGDRSRMSRLTNFFVIGVIVVIAAGCSSTDAPNEFVNTGTSAPTARATPLATEAAPATTPKPRAKATAKAGAYYRPPGWDGSSDVNCSDFDTHAHAESFFKGTGGSKTNDPYGLDRDHDGIACETLP